MVSTDNILFPQTTLYFHSKYSWYVRLRTGNIYVTVFRLKQFYAFAFRKRTALKLTSNTKLSVECRYAKLVQKLSEQETEMMAGHGRYVFREKFICGEFTL